MADNQFTDLPPGATVVQPGGFTDMPAGATVQQSRPAVDLRRPQQPSQPQGQQQPNGFEVNILGRRYIVGTSSQEIADRAAAAVTEYLNGYQPPDPNVPQVPNEDAGTPEEQITAAIEDRLQRELNTADRAARPWYQKVGDFTRDLLQGVTLGAGDEIVAGIDALIPGGMNYNERLAYEQQQLAAHRAESPVFSTATEIAGGLPLLRTPGALPQRGQSFGTNVARSTANAAAIGTAYGALGTNGGLEERLQGAGQGAALGAGIGAAVPVLGRLVSPIANAAMAGLPNANRTLVEAFRQSGTTGPDVASMLRRNPNLTAADVDPNAMILAQGVAAQPGEGRNIISQAMRTRQADAPNRVSGIFDQSMGPNPDTVQVLEGMRQTARTNASQGFGQALAGSPPVDLSATIAAIDARLFPGGFRPQNWQPLTPLDAELASIRDRLTQGGTGLVTDPNVLHSIQSDLRTQAAALGQSATGSERRMGTFLNQVRQNIVDAIDEATGGPPAGTQQTGAAQGPYRAAQAQYADDMQVREAFDKGFTILQNPTSGEAALAARPEAWREWAAGLTPDELEAARLGARAQIDTAINSARNAAARGAAIPDVGNVYDRLAILFGPDEAARIAALLGDEQTMARSSQALLGGSQTELRRQGAEATNVRDVFSRGSQAGTGVLGIGAAFAGANGQLLPAIALGAAGAANIGRRYLGRLLDQAHNAELARVVTASGPEAQARLGSLIGPLSLRSLMTPNRLVELGLAPARTAIPAATNY